MTIYTPVAVTTSVAEEILSKRGELVLCFASLEASTSKEVRLWESMFVL